MPRNEAYRYNDSRPVHIQDGRHHHPFTIVYRSELAHLVAADCSRAAILLYLYLGTRCSGNREGWRVGGSELATRLRLGRSTIYRALAELVSAGVLRALEGPGPRFELVDVQGEPWPTEEHLEGVRTTKREARDTDPSTPHPEAVAETPENPKTAVPHAGQGSSHMRDNRQTSSVPKSTPPSPPCPPDSCSPVHYQVEPPVELAQAVWGCLAASASTAPYDLWYEATEATAHKDCRLTTRVVAHLSLNAYAWNVAGERISTGRAYKGTLRRRWVAAALKEAGTWGPNFEVDGVVNGAED